MCPKVSDHCTLYFDLISSSVLFSPNSIMNNEIVVLFVVRDGFFFKFEC